MPDWLEIGERAFAGCTALESVEIERDDTIDIYHSAFADCASLREVKIKGSIF